MKRFLLFALFVLVMLFFVPGAFADCLQHGFGGECLRYGEPPPPPPFSQIEAWERGCADFSACASRQMEQNRREDQQRQEDQRWEMDRRFGVERRHNEHMDLLREQNRYLYGR